MISTGVNAQATAPVNNVTSDVLKPLCEKANVQRSTQLSEKALVSSRSTKISSERLALASQHNFWESINFRRKIQALLW